MTVYHGTYCEIISPKIIEGKYTKDFGTGFYCTILKEQAEKWAKRYNTPIVCTYEYNANPALRILEFKEMTEEWLDFIVSCRKGEKHDYDIVIGAMADDQIFNYISDFVNGVITRKQFWALAEFKYPTHQINFCNEEAVKCLTYISSEEISK